MGAADAGRAALRRQPRRAALLPGCAVLAAAAVAAVYWAAPVLGFAWAPVTTPPQRSDRVAGPAARQSLAGPRPLPGAVVQAAEGRAGHAAAAARRPSGAEVAEAASPTTSRGWAGGRTRRWLAAGGAALAVAVCGRPVLAATVAPVLPQWAAVPPTLIFHLFERFPAFYFLPMVFLPRWAQTKKFAKSNLPFILCGAVYIYAFVLSRITNPEQTFLTDFVTGQATLGGWRSHLATDSVIGAKSLLMWVAMTSADVFIGRHIYLDSIKAKVFAFHSMMITLLVSGPLGYMVHALTKALIGRSHLGLAESVDEEDPLPNQY